MVQSHFAPNPYSSKSALKKMVILMHPSLSAPPCLFIVSNAVENPEFQSSINIPKVYHNFLEVFSKATANGLPPYRNYDCAIELLPGMMLPCNPFRMVQTQEVQCFRGFTKILLKVHPEL